MRMTTWSFSIVIGLLLSLGLGAMGGVVLHAAAESAHAGALTSSDDGLLYSARDPVGLAEHDRTHQGTWVNITSPKDGDVLNTMEVTVVGTAFDDFHLDSVMLSRDGENWVPAILIIHWGDLHRGRSPEGKAGPQGLPMNAAEWSGHLKLSLGLNTIYARATDQTGKTATESIRVTVADVLPSAPWGLRATAGDRQVRLAWMPSLEEGSSSITHYNIYRGTTPGSLPFIVEVADVYAYTDPAVAETTVYYYQVSATNAAGESLLSNEVSIRLPDRTRPTIAIGAPEAGSVLTSESVMVSGTASDNVEVAKVELSVDGTNWVLASGTTSWSGTLKLTGAQSTIHARVTDLDGNSATVTTAVTVATPPPAVQVSPSSVALTAFGILAAVGVVSVFLLWRRARGGSSGGRP